MQFNIIMQMQFLLKSEQNKRNNPLVIQVKALSGLYTNIARPRYYKNTQTGYDDLLSFIFFDILKRMFVFLCESMMRIFAPLGNEGLLQKNEKLSFENFLCLGSIYYY